MGERQARRLCPQAIVVRPRMEAYSEASKAMFAVFRDTTPLVKGSRSTRRSSTSAGCDGSPAPRRRSAPDCGSGPRAGRVPITVGIARTKFLAKVASAVGKPDGLLVVPIGEELAFLHALPVERLWGVGPVTAKKLHQRSIVSVADVAALEEAALVAIVGRAAGRHLHALAHNRDPRRIDVGRRRRSIGTQRALGRRARSPETLDIDLIALVDRLARRLRKAHRVSRTVTLRLRFDDFSRATGPNAARGDGRYLALLTPAASCSARPCRDRAARHHADRDHLRQPVRRRRGPDGAAVRRPDVDRHRLRRSTGSATDSVRKPSPAAYSSDAETGCRCPSFPTDTVPNHGEPGPPRRRDRRIGWRAVSLSW